MIKAYKNISKELLKIKNNPLRAYPFKSAPITSKLIMRLLDEAKSQNSRDVIYLIDKKKENNLIFVNQLRQIFPG